MQVIERCIERGEKREVLERLKVVASWVLSRKKWIKKEFIGYVWSVTNVCVQTEYDGETMFHLPCSAV